MTDSIHEASEMRRILDAIEARLSLARIRRLPTVELIVRIPRLWEDPSSEDVIDRLHEVELDHSERKALAAALDSLAHAGDGLRASEKSRVDRMLARIVQGLPQELVERFAYLALEHPRKARRQLVYRVLRRRRVTEDLAHRLLERFRIDPEQSYLELIARSPETVGRLDARHIMRLIDEHYWRMRVMEGLVLHNPEDAITLCAEFPREFAHAVGRCRAGQFLSRLELLYDKNKKDLEFLSLYCWALGELDSLERLESIAEDLRGVLVLRASGESVQV